MAIAVKRAYETAAPSDGYCVLLDRLWHRGLTKAALPLDEWFKEPAPSTALRPWFGHDAARWEGFRHRYASELDALADHGRPLAERAARHSVTLLCAARDEEHHQAVVPKSYIDNWLRGHGPR
jgi:uncharacterized protein YeaO (DUF488 family)